MRGKAESGDESAKRSRAAQRKPKPPSAPQRVLDLQRLAGNQAVTQSLTAPPPVEAVAAPQRAAELGAGVLAAVTPPRVAEPVPQPVSEPEDEAEETTETAEVAEAPETAEAALPAAPEVPAERPLAPAAAE